MNPDNFDLISIGNGGFTGYRRGESGWTSGYDRQVPRLAPRLAEGGILLDNLPCATRRDFGSLVINSPLVDINLAPGTGKECPVPDESFVAALGTGFRELAQIKRDHPAFTGLDTVALDVYLGYWRPFGARVGRREGDELVWEDGTREPIAALPAGA